MKNYNINNFKLTLKIWSIYLFSSKMPQLFQALRCYKCLAFQVHQTKKSNKFSCKICDEKQSIKRHYGIGIAKDCRLHVQKLNKMRGENDTRIEDVFDDDEEANMSNSTDTSDTSNVKRTSKWSSYIDKQIEENNIEYNDRSIDHIDNEIISETNYHNSNKRLVRNKQYKNYKPNNKLKARHCNVIDENGLNINENILHNNTKKDFGKRPLSENEDNCRINKVSKLISDDVKSSRNNNNHLEDSRSINKSPKLQPPEINKSSKWAQFIERNNEMGEKSNNEEAVENFPKNKQLLFSLCDDSDIDDVLDI